MFYIPKNFIKQFFINSFFNQVIINKFVKLTKKSFFKQDKNAKLFCIKFF